MSKLIFVYDSVQKLKETLLGDRGEYWDGDGVLTIFEYVFDIIAHAASAGGLSKDEACGEIIAVLEDDKADPVERARRLLGME